jgi:hypothetical protein
MTPENFSIDAAAILEAPDDVLMKTLAADPENESTSLCESAGGLL